MSELSIVDDMGKTYRHYSFLEEALFSSYQDEFFLSSVQHWKIGSCLRDGNCSWGETAIKEFLRHSNRIWANVIYTLFIGMQLSTHVAQFLQIQLCNADRPQNLILQGKEAIFKESNMQLWESGVNKMMACTSAFRTGVDKPNVCFVIIHSPKYNLMSVLWWPGELVGMEWSCMCSSPPLGKLAHHLQVIVQRLTCVGSCINCCMVIGARSIRQ